MLKETIFRWKTRAALRTAPKRETVDFNSAKHIGLLFENDVNHAKARFFIESLVKEGKKVSTLIKSNDKEAPSGQHYTEKQCKWYGKVDSDTVKKFVETPFDYVLMLNDKVHYLNKYILASSKAKCRVGLHNKQNEAFFELMFHNARNESIEKFFDDVKGYLNKIKNA